MPATKTKSRLLFTLLLCIGTVSASIAQPDSLFALDKVNSDALFDWYAQLPKQDSTEILRQFDVLEKFYKKSKRQELRKRIWFHRMEYSAVHLTSGTNELNDRFLHAIAEADNVGWSEIKSELEISLGYHLFEHNRWGPAFEFILKGHQQMSLYGYEQFPWTRRYLYILGILFYRCAEYEKSIYFLRKFISYWHDPMAQRFGCYSFNTLGLAYQKTGRIDSAVYFYQLTMQSAEKFDHKVYILLASGNLGQTYLENNQPEAALPLLMTDYLESPKHGMAGSSANAAISLAQIYLSKGDPGTAEAFLDKGRGVFSYPELMPKAKYYELRFALNKMKKKWQEAVHYSDSAKIYLDSIARSISNVNLEQSARRVEIERHTAAIHELETARKRQVFLRNFMLVFLFLTALIIVQFLQRRVLRRNKELEVASLNEQIARHDLEIARGDLERFTTSIKEKNDLIGAIREEMNLLKILETHKLDERTERIHALLHHPILTEEDWEDFRLMFEKVYPAFFIRLKEKMPDLTPADIRLLALTKLQLSSREMASLLGISVESIKKSRQRLRKRNHLPEEGDLDEVVVDL